MNQIREQLIQKIWFGQDPFSGINPSLYKPDLQGWSSSTHFFLSETISELRPQIIVEVGVWKGKSVAHMAKILNRLEVDGVIIAVDTWLGSVEHWTQERYFSDLCIELGRPNIINTFMTNMIREKITNYVIPLPLDSINAARLCAKHDIVIDMIHIDAGHDYKSVYSDLSEWWPLVRPGGVIVGDDYSQKWPEVIRAWDDYLVVAGNPKFQVGDNKCRAFKPG